jgi:uncharacterized protein (DUF1697 family)
MPRYVAFLRGVSPLNAKMPELKRCFEQAGFTSVKTVLSSGNVVFDARASKEAALERKAEAAMQTALGRSFQTFIRSADRLQAMLAADPYAPFELSPGAKRVVTFLREPHGLAISTPIERDEARILRADEREVFSACVPGPRGSVFMALLERTFGAAITTRTWDTVRKCGAA